MLRSTLLSSVVLLSPWSYVDDICVWAVVLIGVVTGIRLRAKLGKAVLPLVGLFVLMADSRLYWAQFLAKLVFVAFGYEAPAGTLAWYLAWRAIPVIFAAVMAAAFVSEIRRRGAYQGAPS